MSDSGQRYDLPQGTERYLAALSKLYGQEGKRQFQEILVNAQTRIVEAWTSDNWNGGTYGHALFLVVPEPIFLAIARERKAVEAQICKDLNEIQNVANEFFAEVFVEMEVAENTEWRQDSGLMLVNKRPVSPDAQRRIWEEGSFRLFMSHKSEIKAETSDLKTQLHRFGISAFVAHQDIRPTKAWQDEIENALATMDGFVALMTSDFHDSDWTDQEVGYALARGVPTMAVKLGKDPYGFMAKFQAIPGDWSKCPIEIARVVIRDERGFNAYVAALKHCNSWEGGNVLAMALSGLERLRTDQIDQLVTAYNDTRELWGSWGFNGTRQWEYGPGLVAHLNRLGTRLFKFRDVGGIETA